MALAIASHGYVMETGRVVKDGPAADLLADQDIQEFYLGVGETGPALVPRRQVLPPAEAMERLSVPPTAEPAADGPAPRRAAARGRGRHAALRRRDRARRRLVRGPARRAVRRDRPQRRRQDVDLQLHQRRLPAAEGLDPARRRGPDRPLAAGGRAARRGAHVPEPRPVRAPVGDRQPDARPPPPDAHGLHLRRRLVGPGASARRSSTARRSRRWSSCSSWRPHRHTPAGLLPVRPPEAARARPRAGDGAAAAAARRAGGRHEPRGDRGHGALRDRGARAARASR